MKNLEEIIDKIEKNITEKEKIREETLQLSRKIILNSRKAIQKIHQNEFKDASNLIEETKDILIKLSEGVKSHPDLLYTGYVENASQEFIEALSFLSIMEDKPLPDPDQLPVSYISYLQGLCDLIGELRRKTLSSIIEGEPDLRYLTMMEEIYTAILRFDYPSALIPIKRKQDIARSLIEKTRGELAVANAEHRMEQQIEEFKNFLEETVEGKRKTARKSELDIDRIW
ncbi:MAG TPA: RNA-binding protein [Thermoplasmatales archaeon]|nr:RNA-binding protein [Thermoplasmatales archaeon]